jgi:uncharacterized damage-inducible protein DinB
MTMIELFTDEFEHEVETTRRHLERTPADKLGWRPHQKSYTLLELATHIVDCVGWTESIFGADEYDVDPATFRPCNATSPDGVLKAFDEKVAAGRRALAQATEEQLARPWRFKIRGRQRFERPRVVVFRDFTLSHLVHHRGQFSVYLRLLDVPVPGSYGPTADEGG